MHAASLPGYAVGHRPRHGRDRDHLRPGNLADVCSLLRSYAVTCASLRMYCKATACVAIYLGYVIGSLCGRGQRTAAVGGRSRRCPNRGIGFSGHARVHKPGVPRAVRRMVTYASFTR